MLTPEDILSLDKNQRFAALLAQLEEEIGPLPKETIVTLGEDVEDNECMKYAHKYWVGLNIIIHGHEYGYYPFDDSKRRYMLHSSTSLLRDIIAKSKAIDARMAELEAENARLRAENAALRVFPGGPEYQEALVRFDAMRFGWQ